MNKVFADGDVKGNAVKIRGGLATVTGDKGFNMPLGGILGRRSLRTIRKPGNLPSARQITLLSEGKGGVVYETT